MLKEDSTMRAKRNGAQARGHSESKRGSQVARTQPAQVSLLGNRDVAQTEPKATEQVAYLLR